MKRGETGKMDGRKQEKKGEGRQQVLKGFRGFFPEVYTARCISTILNRVAAACNAVRQCYRFSPVLAQITTINHYSRG